MARGSSARPIFAIDGVRRMDELINDLLAYSTADRTSNSEVDAQTALAEAVDRLGLAITETGARIRSSPLPRVVAGPDRLVGLFQNLVSNSIKYRDERRPPEIRVSADRGRGPWRFEVGDNGRRDSSPADAERVFRIFERLDGDRGIRVRPRARHLPPRRGGAGRKIWAESERPVAAAVFRFTLPAAPASASVSYMEEGV